MYQPKTSTSLLVLCKDVDRVVESLATILAATLILDERENPPARIRFQGGIDVKEL
jgi:hypothetical protein